MIPEKNVSGERVFVPHAGGSIFNTEIALGRLGVNVGMLTGLSTDLFGQQILGKLTASHVDSSNIVFTDRPITLAFIDLKNGQAIYSFFDENSAGRMLLPAQMPAISSKISTLHFGGISLACEPSGETYAQFMDKESPRRTIILDPNIRKCFIKNEETYRSRLERMISQSDIVKVSDEDLNWIDDTHRALHDKARGLLTKGASLVILTEGEEGATGFLPGGGMVEVPVCRVDVVDTVGAGDTFNAGLLAKLPDLGTLHKDGLRTLSAETVESALGFASRIASKTVSQSGANSPWASEL